MQDIVPKSPVVKTMAELVSWTLTQVDPQFGNAEVEQRCCDLEWQLQVGQASPIDARLSSLLAEQAGVLHDLERENDDLRLRMQDMVPKSLVEATMAELVSGTLAEVDPQLKKLERRWCDIERRLQVEQAGRVEAISPGTRGVGIISVGSPTRPSTIVATAMSLTDSKKSYADEGEKMEITEAAKFCESPFVNEGIKLHGKFKSCADEGDKIEISEAAKPCESPIVFEGIKLHGNYQDVRQAVFRLYGLVTIAEVDFGGGDVEFLMLFCGHTKLCHINAYRST